MKIPVKISRRYIISLLKLLIRSLAIFILNRVKARFTLVKHTQK